MSTAFYCLLLLAVLVTDTDAFNNPLERKPNVARKNFSTYILQDSVFPIINTIAFETSGLRESQKNITNALVEIKERLFAFELLYNFRLQKLETKISEFMEKSNKPVDVFLNKSREWTIIARRRNGSVSFDRNWTQYENGFGNPRGEFFIGLKTLHYLTTMGEPQELLIVLTNQRYRKLIARYDNFRIGNAEQKYKLLELGKYSGDAGDGLVKSLNQKFSTYDCENNNNKNWKCAKELKGGWWFKDCDRMFLFAPYNDQFPGISWGIWLHGLKAVEIRMRAKL